MGQKTTKKFSHLAVEFQELSERMAFEIIGELRTWTSEVGWIFCEEHETYSKGSCPVCVGKNKSRHISLTQAKIPSVLKGLLENYEHFELYKDFYDSTKEKIEQIEDELE